VNLAGFPALVEYGTGIRAQTPCRKSVYSNEDQLEWRFARGRGKTRQREGADACVSQGVGAETPIDRLGRLQPDRGNQVLIAAISGPTPKIVIIRFRL
jgi:hypothetical protein